MSAEDSVGIRRWGLLHLDFLLRFQPFSHGVPGHNTLNDIINALDASLFANAARCHGLVENRLH